MPQGVFPGRGIGRVWLACVLLLAWGPSAQGADGKACVELAACDAAIAAAAGAPEKARLLVDRARLLRHAGDLDGAEADLAEATDVAPEDADIFVELGYLRRAQGDFEAALAAQDRALELAPDDWRALLNRMDSLASLGRDEACLKDAPRAVALAPEQPYTYAYRGRCRAGIGKTALAVEDYRKAVGMGLDEAFLHANLALAELDLGRNEVALVSARKAVARDAANEYGQYGLIDALMQLGRPDEAIAAYDAAKAKIRADTLGLANLTAWELYRRGRAEDALPIIEEFLAHHPDPSAEQVYEVDTYAHILAALGNGKKALEQFLRAADLGGAEKQDAYRRQLARLEIDAAPGREGLAVAIGKCVEMGSRCRLSD